MRFLPLVGLSPVILGVAAGPVLCSGATDHVSNPAPAPATPAPEAEVAAAPAGEGVLCGWAFLILTREVGKQCFAGQDAEFQAQLNDSVQRIDDYVAKNGNATPAEIADFKREQGHEGGPASFLCRGDALQLYAAYRSRGASAVKYLTDAMVSRPGKPTWGTCT